MSYKVIQTSNEIDINVDWVADIDTSNGGGGSAVQVSSGIFLTVAHSYFDDSGQLYSINSTIEVGAGLSDSPTIEFQSIATDTTAPQALRSNEGDLQDAALIETGNTQNESFVPPNFIVFQDPEDVDAWTTLQYGYPAVSFDNETLVEASGNLTSPLSPPGGFYQELGIIRKMLPDGSLLSVDQWRSTADSEEGFSGSGVWLEVANRDYAGTYLSGLASGVNNNTGVSYVEPIGDFYWDLAGKLSGSNSAEDFGTHVLVMDQTGTFGGDLGREKSISGTFFNERIFGSSFADDIRANDGEDIVFSGSGDDTVFGGNQDDELHGQDDNDFLKGEAGNDSLFGGDGIDELYGDENDDTLDGGLGNDLLYGGTGNDTAVFSGNRSDYGFSSDISGGIGVTNGLTGEKDVLFQIERIQFADMITDQFGNEIIDGPSFPDNGVSNTISLASAVGEFGATDGSDVARLFLESLGATVENVTYTGSETAAFLVSEFEIPGTPIDYQGGIMLSSGGFPGPSNTQEGFTVFHGTPGDSDLDAVAQQAFPGAGQTEDASVLEFRLFVEDPSQLSFDLVFGSDEYPEFANSSFVDVAAVFVNGENVALFPGSDAPLSITNENVLNNLADNRNGVFATEWDGFAALGLTANLDAGWNDIKIGVADTGDSSLDTAIYLTDFELTSNEQDDDAPTGEVRLKNVGGPLDNSLTATFTPEEHTFYEPSSPSEPNVPGSLSGTATSFNNDVVTNFKSDDEIRLVQLEKLDLLKQALDLAQQLLKLKKGSAIVEIDEDLDGTVDSVLTLEGEFVNSRFKGEIVEDDFVLTLEELNLVAGSEASDYLRGTGDADALRSLGGSYDRMMGGDGADQFIFGAETNNGSRERDVIMDYEIGVDAIVLEDGASVASIKEGRGQLVIFLEGDRDAIYVRGDGITSETITIIEEDVFQLI